jgi:hypothetical protein
MQVSFYLISWAVLAVVVAVLAVYRISLGRHDDVMVHLAGPEASLIPQQAHLATRMRKVEVWGQTLTAVMAVYGLTLLAIWAYRAWESGNQISFH